MSNISLGIDVSKLELSVALLKGKKPIKRKFPNNKSGFKELHQWLQKNNTKDIKICIEATGHYSFGIANFLYHKGYNTYVINPFCIKSFGHSKLSRNKTDEADAVIIAEYIAKNEPRAYKPISKTICKIRELDKCLETLKLNRAQIKIRIIDTDHLPKEVVNAWEAVAESLDKQIKNIELELQTLINSNSKLNQDFENLKTIPGISSTTAILKILESPYF